MLNFRILLFLILLLPINCLNESRKNIRSDLSEKSPRFDDSDESKGYRKTVVTDSPLPDTPLHLSGEYIYEYSYYSYGRYFLAVTDELIYLIGRSYDYYYKWVFKYKYEVKNNTISLSDIKIDENNSKFLFSENNDLGTCKAELEKEYSYKELKIKCILGVDRIEEMIKVAKKATKILCDDSFRINLPRSSSSTSSFTNLYQNHTLDEINYIVNNMKIGSYSPSTEFVFKSSSGYMKMTKEKCMEVEYNNNIFTFNRRFVTLENETNYIYDGYYYYLCLYSDCKHIIRIKYYENNWMYYNVFENVNDFDSEFNNLYKKAYNDAQKSNSNKNNLRRYLVEEEEKNNIKESNITYGYFYEDVRETYDGYYRGYFVIDDIVTIIDQTKGEYPEDIEQMKLVFKLNNTNDYGDIYTTLNSLDDEVIDKEKSGVEPKYDNNGDYDESCSRFIPLKDKNKYDICGINATVMFERYIASYIFDKYYKELCIDETKIDLRKFPNATELNSLIESITKYTKPIPDNKCIKYYEIDESKDKLLSLYNNIFYYYLYVITDSKTTLKFSSKKREDTYYNTHNNIYYFNSIEGYDGYYIDIYPHIYHKYVYYYIKGREYEECNEDLKNDMIIQFEDRIKQIRKEEGIRDDSENPTTNPTPNPTSITPSTPNPTTSDKNQSSLTTAEIIGIVIGVTLCSNIILILIMICYIRKCSVKHVMQRKKSLMISEDEENSSSERHEGVRVGNN